MKLNRILVMCLAVVLSATLAIGGTLAYLQDTDSDVNVMTLGSVYIDQIEQEWNADVTKLVDFKQAKPLYPNVGEFGWTNDEEANGAYRRFTMSNVVDKYVSVKNTGKSSAYVRTIIALEMGGYSSVDEFYGSDKIIGVSRNAANGAEFKNLNWIWEPYQVEKINGRNYMIMVATHDAAVAPGATTLPSLLQVYMSSKATNETVEKVDGNKNGTYDILVLSQAVQADGWAAEEIDISTLQDKNQYNGSNTITTAARNALNSAFGAPFAEVDGKANVVAWLEGLETQSDSTAEPLVLTEGKPVTLTGTQGARTVSGEGTLILNNVTINAETGSALTVAAGSDVKIAVVGNNTLTGATNGSGIVVEEGAALEIYGEGSLTAIGNGGQEDIEDGTGGSGIGGAGDIVIRDLANLNAKGYGKHAFGIGGASENITIENTTISYVKGGYVQAELVYDTKYGKDEPEGGAAIGSSTDGAKIVLNGVTIDKAEGGSKAAGIGAKFWTGVEIEITDSTIKSVVGGATSAGIGGSRVRSTNAAEQDVKITIVDSNITAQGGDYGAGIGSGYDTHCTGADSFPMHEIYIKGNSTITATGGKYAAGIGTGYHVGGLSGEIESTVTVNAKAGETFYKDTYTRAQDVGFGIVDPAREGKNNTCTITYNNQVIGIPVV